jgi:alkanesulfonate monooxygenase SsuD/methylene tetrahydromethanopterin reductase-like flavin-dependent oxidoreductase (luciferase family)
MDEGLKMLDDLFAGRPITEPGSVWDATGLELEPLPKQQPCPLWIGGGGPKAIERAARFGSTLCPVNLSAGDIRDTYRPELDAAASRYGRTVELACVNYVLVVDDEEQLETYFRPRMLARLNEISVEEALAVEDKDSLRQPDDHIAWGTPQQCADALVDLFDAGADYLVLDFNLHGIEDENFARHHMERFVEDVVPLMEGRCPGKRPHAGAPRVGETASRTRGE